MKQRIWELDVFRGLCIIAMVVTHFYYDLVDLYHFADGYPLFIQFFFDWGGILFILLSGLCVTLGSHSVRRGSLVFACGLLVTLVTAGIYWLGFTGKGIIIYFGILHCLGICMLLWPLFKKCPTWLLAVLGVALIALGVYLRQEVRVDFPYLIPLGVMYNGFSSSDYFPLLPNLGYFLLGAVIGRTVYKNKQTLLPKVNPDFFLLRFLRLCGRHSLLIYLAHQPVLAGFLAIVSMLR